MAAKITFAVALLLVGAAYALSAHDVANVAPSRSVGYQVRQAALVEVMDKIRDKAPIDELRKILNSIEKHIADDLAQAKAKLAELVKNCQKTSTDLLAQKAKLKRELENIRRQVAQLQRKLEEENVELNHVYGLINKDRTSINKNEVDLNHAQQEKEDSQLTFEQKLAEMRSFLEALYDIKAVVLSSVLVKRKAGASGASKLEAGVDRAAEAIPQPSSKVAPVPPQKQLSAEERGLGDANAELLEKSQEKSNEKLNRAAAATAGSPAATQIKALLLSLSERVAPEHRDTLDLARSLIEAGAPIDNLVKMIEKLIHSVETDIKNLRKSHTQHITSVIKQAKETSKLVEALLKDLAAHRKRGNTLKAEIAALVDKMMTLAEEVRSRTREIRIVRKKFSQNEFDCHTQQNAIKKNIESLLEEQSVLANLRNIIEKKIGSASMFVKKRIGHVTLSNSYHIGPFSRCSVTCGKGVETREVYCVNFAGDKVNENNCANFTKPRTHQECILKDCPRDCVEGEWRRLTECSTTCGSGFYTLIRDTKPGDSGGRACGPSTKMVSCNNPSCGELTPSNSFDNKKSLLSMGHAYIALDTRNPSNHVLKFSGCSSNVVDVITHKYVKSTSGKYRISFDYRANSANMKKATDGLTVGLVDQEKNHIILATRDRNIPSAIYHFGNIPETDSDGDFIRVSFVFDANNAPTGRFFPHKGTTHPTEIAKSPVAVFLSEKNSSGAGCGQVEVDNLSIEEIRD